MMTDLAGRSKQIIFKPKDRVVSASYLSRDSSLVLMTLVKPDRSQTFGVVRTDGTAYREFGEHPLGTWTCPPEFSWDNRSVLLCEATPDGHPQVVRVSVADGEIHKLGEATGDLYRLSPDGHFIAYLSFYEVFVMPSQGGEPHLVLSGDMAVLMDWTRDGHYLAVSSNPGGSRAISLLPMKDGQRAGAPVLVRYGSFESGRSTASGGLLYSAVPQGGSYTHWLGRLDATGRSMVWERLSLAGSNSTWPTWSPDGAQFAYVALDFAAGQYAAGALRLHTIASGEERELYRANLATISFWSSQHPNILCFRGAPDAAEVISVSTDDGRAEVLSAYVRIPGAGQYLFRARDDRSLYAATRQGLMRWEIGSQEWTMVSEAPNLYRGYSTGIASPDERWITRWENGKIEIRPMASGGWKPLPSLGSPNQIAFTADGDWLVYHDRDASGKDGLFRMATTGGDPERLGDFPGTSTRGLMWVSPDGQKIIADARKPIELWMLENFEPKQQAVK